MYGLCNKKLKQYQDVAIQTTLVASILGFEGNGGVKQDGNKDLKIR